MSAVNIYDQYHYSVDEERSRDSLILDSLAGGHAEPSKDNEPIDEKEIRSCILAQITDLLVKASQRPTRAAKKPAATTTEMAKVLEHHLFRTAATWEQYRDTESLPSRLQFLVHRCRSRSSWQRKSPAADDKLRRQMISRVKQLIEERITAEANNDPDDSNNKRDNQSTFQHRKNIIARLPLMAQRVEEALYRSAPTREEYADMDTLESRLHNLALEYQSYPVF